MAEMSRQEWRAFLTEPVRTAKLATSRADGRPHVAPIWFALDDDDTIVFTTGATTVKGRGIVADPRVALCVDDDRPPFSFVVVEGVAEVVDDAAALLAWATRLGARYMGEARAAEYGRRNGVPGELLVRVTPTKVLAHKNISD
jgi:PPOX class probable F420-dependent enzyme